MNQDSTTNSFKADRLFLEIEIDASHPVTATVFPEHNFMGGLLLSKLLDAKLDAGGQLLTPVPVCGPLNKCMFICTVADWRVARKIIMTVLDNAALLLFARLYRIDECEQILRHLFPAEGKDIFMADFIQACKSLTAEQSVLNEKKLTLLRNLGNCR